MNSKKPNLVIIGQPKAGTTTLHDILSLHPNICGNRQFKDYLFFSRFKGITLENELSQAFSECNDSAKYILDSGANYCVNEEALNQIADLDNVKVIWIVRDPKQRFISEFYYRLYRGRIDFTEQEVVDMEINELRSSFERAFLLSDVDFQKKLIFDLFDNQSVFVLSFTDLVNNELSHLYSWLNLEAIDLDKSLVSNKTRPPRFKMLNSLFFGNHKLEFIKKYFPKSLRKRLGSGIRKANTSKSNAKEILKSNQRFNKMLDEILKESNDAFHQLFNPS